MLREFLLSSENYLVAANEQMVREGKRVQNTVGEWQKKRERQIKKNTKRRVLVCWERN